MNHPARLVPEMRAHGDAFAQIDARQALIAALDRLPPRQRAVVVLRYFAGQTEAQTAAARQVTSRNSLTAGRAGSVAVSPDGRVWGTTGTGMSQWVWFAPGGDLTRSFRVSQGPGAGSSSVPVFSGGVVWVGGSHELICASPSTGQALARPSIPTDHRRGQPHTPRGLLRLNPASSSGLMTGSVCHLLSRGRRTRRRSVAERPPA